MLDQEDLKWIATTSTELNSMLQQIARYSDLARQHNRGENEYIEEMGERVEIASKTAQAIFDRVTNSILTGAATRQVRAKFPAPQSPGNASDLIGAPLASGTRLAGKPAAEPQVSSPPHEAAGTPAEIHVLNPDGSRELILLVDDEVELSTLASEVLMEEGYKVILAKDGFEALRIYQQIGNEIGLVILDFFLPVMDGDAVFDELRAMNPKVTVVLSSGFAEQSKISAMLAQGLRGFIPKPYTREKLLEQISSTLEASRQ